MVGKRKSKKSNPFDNLTKNQKITIAGLFVVLLITVYYFASPTGRFVTGINEQLSEPGFENSLDSWETDGVLSDVWRSEGSSSIQLTSSGTTTQKFVLPDNARRLIVDLNIVEPGTEYELQVCTLDSNCVSSKRGPRKGVYQLGVDVSTMQGQVVEVKLKGTGTLYYWDNLKVI